MMKPLITNFWTKLSILLLNDLVKRLSKFFISIMLIFAAVLIWKWNSLPPQIPLFYSLPRGIETLGTKIQILTLPIYAIIFFITNLTLAALLFEKEKLTAEILVSAGTVMPFLLLITFLKIIFLIS